MLAYLANGLPSEESSNGVPSSYTIAVRTGASRELNTAGEAMALWLRPSRVVRKAFTTRI